MAEVIEFRMSSTVLRDEARTELARGGFTAEPTGTSGLRVDAERPDGTDDPAEVERIVLNLDTSAVRA